MKRMTYFVIALALVLGFTQCKKQVDDAISNNAQIVNITLDVNNDVNSTSRVDVDPYWTDNPTYATVTYTEGDIINVVYKGELVGYLTYSATTQNFSGSISATPEEDEGDREPLYFYFFGRNNELGDEYDDDYDDYDNAFYVSISDQTRINDDGSIQYPVVSYAPSSTNYMGEGSYTAKLQNKCSIVKFNIILEDGVPVPNYVYIAGVKNAVAVYLDEYQDEDNLFFFGSFGGLANGFVKTKVQNHGGNLECWAILLQQENISAGDIGTVYTDNNYMGSRPAIATGIGINQYKPEGYNINITTAYPTNAFSVSASRKVIFSPGNLQYNPSENKWRFAENEWDYIGAQQSDQTNAGCTGGNVSGSDNYRVGSLTGYTGWLDLFGWGTGDKPTCIAHYYDKPTGNQNGYNGEYDWNIDWGQNEIYDGDAPTDKTWFTLSEKEWEYLINETSNSAREGKYGTATVNGAPGLVLLPDLFQLPDGCSFAPGMVHDDDDYYNWQIWTVDDDNVYDAAEWALMSNAGAVFLPAAGSRVITKDSGDVTKITFFHIGIGGNYWSTTDKSGWEDDDEEVWISNAANMHFTDVVDDYGDGDISVTGSGFKEGMSVRLVRDLE